MERRLRTTFLHARDIPASAMLARWSTINNTFPILALIQGMLVLAGGTERWYGAALEIMMTGFPGAHYVAGGVLTLASFVLITAIKADWPFWVWASAWITGIWYFSAMVCTIVQLVETPNGVGTLGPAAWFAFGVVHVIQAQGRVGDDDSA